MAVDIADRNKPALRVVVCSTGDKREALLYFKLVLAHIHPEESDLTAFRMYQVEYCFHGCGFTGTIATDKPHNASRLDRKTHVLQLKTRVGFGEVFY